MTNERKRPTVNFTDTKADSINDATENSKTVHNHSNFNGKSGDVADVNDDKINVANGKSDYEDAKRKLKHVIDDCESDGTSENNENDKNSVRVEELQKQAEELQQKNSELEKKLMYLAAEYENNKRRAAKDIDDASKFSITKFAMDAIKIYDVLITAVDNVKVDNTDKILYDGVKMTISEFDKMFEKMEMKRISPEIGSAFDHNKHEAISRIASDIEIGSIVKVIRAGYELYGRLLRPAMVVVSGGK